MAINPNTNFSAGAVLTASQQNRFPRGIVAVSLLTSNTSFLNAETNRTSVSFTAVANRYYKVSYFEPNCTNAQTQTSGFFLRSGSVSGTLLTQATQSWVAGYAQIINVQYIGTFSAGTVSLYINGNTNSGIATVANASATSVAFLLVEDIGPS